MTRWTAVQIGPLASSVSDVASNPTARAIPAPSSATRAAPSLAAANTSSRSGIDAPAQAKDGMARASCHTDSTSARRSVRNVAASRIACLASSEPS